ncbi:hypothetical protein OF83DRAFT_1108171 [Amylostereum chailletii]|nr:hypothetical protein OF83DRAFT_1108171 [Amylostereum chailletii]
MATSADIEKSSLNLETAKSLQSRLESAQLNILESRSRFNTHVVEGLEDSPGEAYTPGSRPPEVISAGVSEHMSFLRKLKFQYLEENAKDKYIKTIVNDEAPMTTPEDLINLQASNVQKKETLKAAKLKLAEKYQDIRGLAPLVEHDYQKAKTLTDEAVALTKSILDARLAIARLRQSHPHPRMTVSAAEEHLASQIEEMQAVEDEIQAGNDRVARVKSAVKEAAKEVERLRVARADSDRELKAHRADMDDPRVATLYDWYTASLALHRSLLSMESSHSVSENELRLAYAVEHPQSPGTKSKPRIVTVVLLFLPNTRQLADARVEGMDSVDMSSVISAYVQANDVPGLLWAIMGRARQAL